MISVLVRQTYLGHEPVVRVTRLVDIGEPALKNNPEAPLLSYRLTDTIPFAENQWLANRVREVRGAGDLRRHPGQALPAAGSGPGNMTRGLPGRFRDARTWRNRGSLRGDRRNLPRAHSSVG